MLLAGDHIEITLASELIILRPTLHCGFRLERREGSFAKLIADLQEGSLSAAHYVLADHFKRPGIAQSIMDAGIEDVCGTLIPFVLYCAGIDPLHTSAQDRQSGANEVTFAEHLTNLYRIATGWIGWTPEVALNSTPTEIMEAYKGRLDMLKAIYGGSEDDTPNPRKRKTDADDLRSAFRDLGAKTARKQ